jgi:enterochelin esterase-like enzyme
MQLCFIHGLDSSPRGTKASLLKSYNPQFLIPDLPPQIQKRLSVVERLLDEPSLLVGSSLGGLTAILYAMRRPGMVEGMVLLAPAVGTGDVALFNEEEESVLSEVYIPGGIPTVIVAGLRDEVVPLSAIRAMIERSPERQNIRLIEVDDDHDLHQSLDIMIRSIEEIESGAGAHFIPT